MIIMDSDIEEKVFGEGSGDSGEFIVKVEHGMDPGHNYPIFIKSKRGLTGSGYPEPHRKNDQDPLSFATEHFSDQVKCSLGFQGSDRFTERLADDSKTTRCLPLFTSPDMQEKCNVRSDKIQRFFGKQEPELDDLSGICKVDETDSGPPAKRSVFSAIPKNVPKLEYSSPELWTLIASRSGVIRNKSSQDVQVFFSKLHEWAQRQIITNYNKISFFHLLLQTANIAREIGWPEFRLNENWFLKIKEQWKDFIQPVAIHRHSVTSSESVLHSKLVDWYDRTSSMRSVSPGELERKAVEIASDVGEEFRLSKVWVKNFISEFGLYCTINGEHRLYLKPSDGLLKSHFEAAFEHWYYQVDGDLNKAKVKTSNNTRIPTEWKTEACIEIYLNAVLENHLEANDWQSNICLGKTEKEIAAELCGDSEEMLEKIDDWQVKWCSSRNASVLILQRFDAILRKWYNEKWVTSLQKGRPYWLGAMPFEQLKNEAFPTACGLGIYDFTATKNWLKRFLELNGLKYFVNGNSVVFSHIALSRMSEGEFTDLFDNVNSMETVPTIPNTKVYLPAPTKASFRPTVRSGKSSVNKARTNPTASEAQNGGSVKRITCSEVLNGHCIPQPLGTQNMLAESAYPVQKIISASNSLECLAMFGEAVSNWYINESSKGEVFPGDVEHKAYEIAHIKGVIGFAPTKIWLASFVAISGLHFLVNGERVRISKPQTGILKYQFEAAFEAWYMGMSETVVKAELDRYFSDRGIDCDGVKNAVRMFHAAAFDWYRNESSTRLVPLPLPESHIAEEVSSPEFKIDVPDLESWYRAQATKLKNFDREIMASYRALRILTEPCQLKELAEKIAIRKLGMKTFQASKQWMKRFVQRYGLSCKLTTYLTFHFDPTSANAHSFSRVFEDWYDEDTEDWGLIMKDNFMGLRGEIGLNYGTCDMKKNRILADLKFHELSKVLFELRGVKYTAIYIS